MRWNQPWNFSRLLKHLTEHRMVYVFWCLRTAHNAVSRVSADTHFDRTHTVSSSGRAVDAWT